MLLSSNSADDFIEPPFDNILGEQKSSSKSRSSINEMETKWIILLPYKVGKFYVQDAQWKAMNLGYSVIIFYGGSIHELNTNPTFPDGIPTFFISHSDGVALKEDYSYPKR